MNIANEYDGYEWDAFICHASEDKESFVRELARRLISEGLRIWYDDFTLTVGDSLRRSIDQGLNSSRHAVVVLSPSFFSKEWPQRELDGVATRDLATRKVILPVWLNLEAKDVQRFSPTLADRKATKASDGIEKVVHDLLQVLKPEPRKVPSDFPRERLTAATSKEDQMRFNAQLGDLR